MDKENIIDLIQLAIKRGYYDMGEGRNTLRLWAEDIYHMLDRWKLIKVED